jgi:hypothetical protein
MVFGNAAGLLSGVADLFGPLALGFGGVLLCLLAPPLGASRAVGGFFSSVFHASPVGILVRATSGGDDHPGMGNLQEADPASVAQVLHCGSNQCLFSRRTRGMEGSNQVREGGDDGRMTVDR